MKTAKIVIILALVLFLFSSCSPKEDQDAIKAKKIIEYHKKKFDSLPMSGKIVDGIREVEVKASQYKWEPESIVVKKGDRVRLVVTSLDVPHGFEIEGMVIPGWGVDRLIGKGEKAVLEFTAEEAGAWDTVCTGYCGPGHGTMKRKFIVRE